MRKPLAFMTETDKGVLCRESEYIKFSFANRDGVHIQYKSKDTSISLNDIAEIIYDIERDIYIFANHNGDDVLTIQTTMVFLYITEVNDTGAFYITTKEYSDSETYPIFRTEIVDAICTTYCIPAPLVDEFPLLQNQYRAMCVEEHSKVILTLSSMIYQMYSGYYDGDDTDFYIYYNHMIYKINNVGLNALYVHTVDIYDHDKEIEYTAIPYVGLTNFTVFSSRDLFIYEGRIICDGHLVGDIDTSALDPIVYSFNDEEFSNSLIFKVDNIINNISSMVDLINTEGYSELDNINLVDGIKSMKDILSQILADAGEYMGDIFKNNDMGSIVLPYYGKQYVFNYDALNNYVTEIDEMIKSIDTNSI